MPVEVRLSKDFADALQRAGGRVSKPTVAIVGRPNVGKSTLFNRILGGRPAIVSDRPGTTRDRHFGDAEWGGRRSGWWIPAGWCPTRTTRWTARSGSRSSSRSTKSDVVLFVVDGREGLQPGGPRDRRAAAQGAAPVLLAVNKLDDLERSTAQYEFYSARLRRPGRRERRGREGERRPARRGGGAAAAVRSGGSRGAINVAVVGRPNVGKSSLVNRLLGEERHVVAPEAGTTRDAIDSPLAVSGKDTSTSLIPQGYGVELK